MRKLAWWQKKGASPQRTTVPTEEKQRKVKTPNRANEKRLKNQRESVGKMAANDQQASQIKGDWAKNKELKDRGKKPENTWTGKGERGT